LVSVVFANPTSPIWREVHANRAFLDERSGVGWDLFFAGMSGFAPMPNEDDAVKVWDISWEQEWWRYFNPRSFGEVESWIVSGQSSALPTAEVRLRAWRYSGGTDLVSFMVYGSNPDWLSLKSVPLYSTDGERLTLVHITEGLRRWALDDVDPSLAPGEVPTSSQRLLTGALVWSATAVASGLLGNGAFELVKSLTK
jgi:hypothetical protein